MRPRILLIALLAIGISSVLTLTFATETDDWKVPERAAKKKNPLIPDAQIIAVGKDLFVQQCVYCHGDKGRGDGPAARDLDPKPHDLTSDNVARQTDGALFWKIGEGHKPMPRFKPLVSDNDLWHVVCYIRTLAPPATQSANGPATAPLGENK